jgi:hypothetical protein
MERNFENPCIILSEHSGNNEEKGRIKDSVMSG